MKTIVYKYLVILILFMGCKSKEDSSLSNVLEPALHEKLDEYFTALSQLKLFNGVVILEKEGKTIINKAYNIHKDTSSHFYVTNEHQFDLHSIAKLIGKIAVIKLEQEGKIDRTAFIKSYLPNFPNGDKITIQHLLDNTSGLPRELSKKDTNIFELDTEEYIELIKKESLEFEPGTDTRYSNLGFQTVYYIISKITKRPFAQYVEDEIFNLLHMNSSGAHFYSNKNNLQKFAYYHILEEDNITEINHLESDTKKQAKFYTTSSDLILLMNYVNQEPYKTILQKGNGIIGHSGGSEGIRSHLQTNIQKGYSFAFMANYDEIPFSQIITDIQLIIEGKPYVVPKPINRQSIHINPALLQKYVGKYDLAEFNHKELEFRVENDSLILYQDNERSDALFPESDSIFFYDSTSSDSFIFKKVNSGNYHVFMKWKGVEFEGTPK